MMIRQTQTKKRKRQSSSQQGQSQLRVPMIITALASVTANHLSGVYVAASFQAVPTTIMRKGAYPSTYSNNCRLALPISLKRRTQRRQHCEQWTPKQSIITPSGSWPLFTTTPTSTADNLADKPADKKRHHLWLAPLWTLVACSMGVAPMTQPWIAATLGTMQPLQMALATLMLSMGLTITPDEIQQAIQEPLVLWLNVACCFGLMPLVAVAVAGALQLSTPQRIGTLLLGCVSGGQASNLFTLLAGGNVALSVICTLSTTLLGVVMTPLLIQVLLQTTVPVQAWNMIQSVATLVLLPLCSGLVLGRILSTNLMHRLYNYLPTVGLAATMVLVAGGASNAAFSMRSNLTSSGTLFSTIAVSFLLPLLGGAFHG